jgi:hypothetical protein
MCLWIGTNGAGVRKYDLRSTGFERYRYQTDFVPILLISQLGIRRFHRFPGFRLTTDSYHFRYAVDGKGLLWFNRGQPFYRLNLKTKQLQTIQPPELPGESGEEYVRTAGGRSGRANLGRLQNQGGLVRPKQQRWQVFPFRFSVDSDIQQLVVDERALWLATESTDYTGSIG